MTFFPVDKYFSATVLGVATIVIIALFWALGEALILPYWPEAAELLGALGWATAIFVGCRIAHVKAVRARFPYVPERVAVAGLILAVAGEGIEWLSRGEAALAWPPLLLRLFLGLMALTLATKGAGRTRKNETYRQRANHFGKALLEERE